MAQFVNNAIEYIGNDNEIIYDAIDVQICQKILPKINGSFGKLDEPLRKLIAFMQYNDPSQYEIINVESISSIEPSKTMYPESISKLCRLYNNLVNNGFASFLE